MNCAIEIYFLLLEISMFKRNQLTTILAATALLSFSGISAAQETTTGEVSVTVSNGFALDSTDNINFGTIRATALAGTDETDRPFIAISGAGVVTAGGGDAGTMSSIIDGAPARFDISGAAPFTNLTLAFLSDSTHVPFNAAGVVTGRHGIVGMGATALATSAIELATAGGIASDVLFFSAEVSQTQIIGGLNDGDAYNTTTANLRTDEFGAVGLFIGGNLYLDDQATVSPSDGLYTAAYEITVSY
jgi:hypothetical protein